MKHRTPLLLTLCLTFAGSCLAEKAWSYSLTPYLWLAGIKGDVATIPGSPPAPIDIPASDAIADTNISLMFWFDVKKNRHGLFVDFLYSDLRSEEELVPPPVDLLLRSTSKNFLWTMAYEYELRQTDRGLLDLFIGARYWDIDTKLEFGGGLGILEGLTLSHTESWVDPVVGLKGHTMLNDTKFYVSGAAAIGGFDIGSELFYDLVLQFGYKWSSQLGTAIGYRYLDVNYDENEFLYKVSQQGWTLSGTFIF